MAVQILPSVVVDEEIFVAAEITDGIDAEVNGETVRGGGVRGGSGVLLLFSSFGKTNVGVAVGVGVFFSLHCSNVFDVTFCWM